MRFNPKPHCLNGKKVKAFNDSEHSCLDEVIKSTSVSISSS